MVEIMVYSQGQGIIFLCEPKQYVKMLDNSLHI